MESNATAVYWVLVAAGFVLISFEIFVPGAILGIMGVLCLLAAAVFGFAAFGAQGGLISAAGLLIGGTAFLFFWVKYGPKSFIGKWFTLEESGQDFKSFDDSRQALLGKSGMAHTDLRPSGLALIDGQKFDVISEAGFIAHGTPVKVIQVVGARVVVRQIESA